MIPAAPMHPDEFDALLADQTAAADAAARQFIYQETPMTDERKEQMLDFLAGAAIVRIAHLSNLRGAAYDLPIVAEGADFRVTAHDFGAGVELQCTCAGYDVGRACAHIAAVEMPRA